MPGGTVAMTPMTRVLYAYGESPTINLDQANRLFGGGRTTPSQFKPPTGVVLFNNNGPKKDIK